MTSTNDAPESAVSAARDDTKLYGVVGAEHLFFDPASVYEHDIEPWLSGRPSDTREIEEWSVRSPLSHVASAASILERMVEELADDGELDEDGTEEWDSAASAADVIAAVDAFRELWASKITYRMADKHLRSLTLSWNEAGEPLLDDEPLYIKRPVDV